MGGVYDTIEMYDSILDSWTVLSVTLTLPRMATFVYNLDDTNILILGGLDMEENLFNTVEIFDVKEQKWTEKKPLTN